MVQKRQLDSILLNLDDTDHLALLNGRVKFAPGLLPGIENDGMKANSSVQAPCRLESYDDSNWEDICNLRRVLGTGLTCAWYRFTITLPLKIKGLDVGGAQIWFSTSIDDYGEIWVDYPDDPTYKPAQGIADNKLSPVLGYNTENRILISESAIPNKTHVIACLAINGPLAQPLGGVFLRYARLEINQGFAKLPIG
jgi:hypothetical protein